MGIFNWLFGTQVIVTEEEVIIIHGRKVVVEKRHHHHPHIKLIVSSVSLFNQSNPNLIISKTEGQIMADKFKASQGVSYKLAFTKADGSAGDADLNTITASVTDETKISVNPDANDKTVGTILGVSDGQSTVNFTAKSKIGQQPLSASVLITIDSTGGDTSGDATNMSVTLSEAFNQDGSPVV